MKRLAPARAATICAAILAASSALAQNGDRFSAIAYSTTTHAIGTAYDAPSQEIAEQAAVARCAEHADDCESRNWSRNACSALAIDVNGKGGWGAAWGDSYAQAADGAFATCLDFNDQCMVYAWVCNSNAAP